MVQQHTTGPVHDRLFRQIVTVATFSLALMGLSTLSAHAQTDEIQVYDGEIAAPGKINLMLHNNYTPLGLKTPAFPNAVLSNHSLNGVPEWALGVTDWFEAGLYLPLYSVSENHDFTLNGFKLRTLFAVPHAADRGFFYAANFEFSYNAPYWETKRFTSEIRPIVGWHLHPVDIILNPILDTKYDGVRNLDFAPAERVAYNVSPIWAVAAEEYGDYGPIHQFLKPEEQSHQLFGVLDYNGKPVAIETGVGFGLNSASDKLTLKLMLSRDLN
jgi:hypothetical protein